MSIGLFELLGWIVRKPTRQSLWFVVLCFTSGAYAVECLIGYNALTVADTVPIFKLQTITIFLSCLALTQFFASETGFLPRRINILFSSLLLLFALSQGLDLGTLTWDAAAGGITEVGFPFGPRWSFPEAGSGIITDIQQFLSLGLIGHFFYAALKYRRIDRRKGNRLLPIPLFVFVAVLNDILVGFRILTTPYVLEYAFLAIVVYIRIDQADRELRLEAQLTKMAYYDQLTGLVNRTMFKDCLEGAIVRSRRFGKRLALLYLDLDRFKNINDTLGHEAGDSVLVAVAGRFKKRLRRSDIIGRLGGDEFAFVLEGIEKSEDAGIVARSILEDLAHPVSVGTSAFFPGGSIGIAVFPYDDLTADGLTGKADFAMYTAKAGGGNGYRFFSGEMHARNLARVSLEAELRQAIERDEFLLHYQPLVDLATGELVGAEALLRWRRSGDDQLMYPGHFLELAEETGLIIPIGRWALDAACAEAACWEREGEPLSVSVNFSSKQFRDSDLPDTIEASLRRHGLPPRRLIVEVTESTLVNDMKTAQLSLHRLEEMGCSIALDDFGTGYSSLRYLSSFPVGELKIDQSFIHCMMEDPEMQSIVKAVIAMAKSLGIATVAEGVETESERAFLAEHGCDLGQGYLFGRAMDGERFRGLITSHRASPARP